MNIRLLDLILILAVAFLLIDKFKPQAQVSSKTVAPLNGASTNTAPGIIENGTALGDTFDNEVEAMVAQAGLAS